MPPLDDVPHPTSISTEADASIVKGMLDRGDRQHDIAAWFGVNAGRIADIKTGAKFPDVPPAPAHALPPPGPYSYFAPRPGASLAEQIQQALGAQDLRWAQGLATVREELRVSARERRQTNEKIDQLQRQLVAFARDVKLVEAPAAPKVTRRRPLAE